MLNILIPMAGLGSRFARAGYLRPKPLIEVHGVAMIRLVIDNIRPKTSHRFIFIIQRAHDEPYTLSENLRLWAPGCVVVQIDGQTEGAACTALAAETLIDSEDALMIANSDQFIDTDIDAYLAGMQSGDLDGLIMTMPATDPKWSYASLDADGLVTRVVEKQVISDNATVGIYNFAHGRNFVSGARRMIARDRRTGGEFYVAPVYNELIEDDARIGVYDIGADAMHGLGIPNDLNAFLALDLSSRMAERSSLNMA